MRASRQLRTVGLVLTVLGAAGAVLGIGVSILIWKTVPILTVGTHGMLPPSFQSDVLAVLFAYAGMIAMVVAAVGWVLRLAGALAYLAPLAVALGACAFSFFSMSEATAPSLPLLVPLATGYFTSLGLAVWIEKLSLATAPARAGTTLIRLGTLPGQALVTALVALVASIASYEWGLHFPSESVRTIREMVGRYQASVQDVAPPGSSNAGEVAPADGGGTSVASVSLGQAPRRHRLPNECMASDRIGEFCGSVTSVAIAPGGTQFAAASAISSGHVLSLWDRASGTRVWHSDVDVASDPYQAVEFSPDGRFLAFHSRWTGVLLSAVDGKVIRAIPLCGQPVQTQRWPPPRLALTFSPDSKGLLVGGDGLCVTDAETGNVTRRFAVGICVGAEQLRYSDDGSHLATLCNGRLRLWNARSLEPIAALASGMRSDPKRAEPNPGSVEAFQFSLDGKRILTRGADLYLWDVPAMQEVRRIPIPTFVSGLSAVGVNAPIDLSPDGTLAILGGQSGVHVFDAGTGQQRKVLLPGGRVSALAVARDGSFTVVGVADAVVPLRPSLELLTRRDLE
jgi:WD40 repeat protein